MWNAAFIFSNKNHGLQKKKTLEKKVFFTVDYKQIIELHIVRTWRHMQFQ